MDPTAVGAGLLKAASASEEGRPSLLHRLLGPLADEAGASMAQWFRNRRERAERVIEVAESIAGDGYPNTRVVGEVLEAGSWADSEIAAGYLGGVLAGSRDGSGRDDTGLPWARLISGLSSVELAFHYVVYRHAWENWADIGVDANNETQIIVAMVYVPIEYWESITGLEPPSSERALNSAVIGLRRVGLLSENYSCTGRSEAGRAFYGAAIGLTHAGVELFLRGSGLTMPEVDFFQRPAECPLPNQVLSDLQDSVQSDEGGGPFHRVGWPSDLG